MKHARSRAREAALKALYQADVLGGTFDRSAVAEMLDLERLGDESLDYAERLVQGYFDNRDELDRMIAAALENWDLARLAAIDRTILRLAAFELAFANDVPAKVTINEAIELAKRYSTPKSGAFINGVLDHIRRHAKGAT